jgi:signal transduction histidine kinase
MNLNATLALVAALAAGCAAAVCLRLSTAPGWGDQRRFALVASSAAVYSALNVSTNLGRAGPWVATCARIQLLVAALHVVAWLRYAQTSLARPVARWERWYARVLLAGGAAALWPGLAYEGQLKTHGFGPLGLTYVDPVLTPVGTLLLAAFTSVFGLLAWRYRAAWRRGVPHAATHCIGLFAFLLMAVNDTANVALGLGLPYLLDVGFLIPVGAVTLALTGRLASDARDLVRLRVELESIVDARTGELERAVKALHQAEKLAALGQFAAGVAHEVNNPAAAVVANLGHLAGELDRSASLPGDARECIADALTATRRIAAVARQLLDSGRLVSSTLPAERLALAPVVEECLRTARVTAGRRVRLDSRVPADLAVLAQRDSLAQVILNLVLNGVQAIPAQREDGRLVVRGERQQDKVRLTVEDNGCGMSEEVLRRAFEPFFTTKPFGEGTGLGLAVSRGLVAALGGDQRLESRPGAGTRAVLELPASDAAVACPPPAGRAATGTR